jgi:protein TonB
MMHRFESGLRLRGRAGLRMRVRGAIATKLVIVTALGAGVFWTAPFGPRAPAPEQSAVTGTRIAQNDTGSVGLPRTSPAPSSPTSPAADPFAGVDVRGDPVLRHIAGIEDPRRASPVERAQRTGVPARVAAAPRDTAVAEAPRTLPPPAQPAPTPAAPEPSAPALASQTRDAPVVTPPQVEPPAADPPAKPAAERSDRAAATPVQVNPPAADTNRVVALARPDATPATPATSPTVVAPRAVRRTVPVFPNEAIKAGIKTGRVLARITIDADGRVSDSQIVNARPPGYFEKESQRALSAWRYEAPGRATTTEVELLFSRD